MTQKKAIIIIPTYNERENITHTVEDLMKVFKTIKNWEMNILVVDDSSPDKTYEVVQKLQKRNSKIFLLINNKKSGLGGAYLKGMEQAYHKLGADVAFEFDADLSHDPTKIPLFLQEIDKGADMVLGSRYIAGGGIPADWGIHRKFLSRVGNTIIRIVLTNFSIKDWTSGFRAITKEVYNDVHKNLTDERFAGYTFQIGSLHKAVKKGYKIVEIPFKFKDRTIGQSKIGAEYIKNTLIYIMKVRLEEIFKHRLFKFVVVGGTGALIQLTSLQVFRNLMAFQLAFFLSIEVAVASNFVLSNLWTFADRKLPLKSVPKKFVMFNLASGGSILIQQVLAFFGETFIGLKPLFTLPIIKMVIDTGLVFAVSGILIGMFWNFFAYDKIIWKKKK